MRGLIFPSPRSDAPSLRRSAIGKLPLPFERRPSQVDRNRGGPDDPGSGRKRRNQLVCHLPQRTKPPHSSQILPNKSKQNSLDLFGFIRLNRDFSMGYGESK